MIKIVVNNYHIMFTISNTNIHDLTKEKLMLIII